MKEAHFLHLTVQLSALRLPALNGSPMARLVGNCNSHRLRYFHRLLTTPLFCFNSSLLGNHNYRHNKVTSSSSFSHNSRLQYPPHPFLVVLSSLVLQLPSFVVNAFTVISMDIASPSAPNIWHEKPLLVSSLNLSLVKHLLLLPQFKHLSPLLLASLIHNAILPLHPVQVSTQSPQRPHNPVYVIDCEESSSEILNPPLSAVFTCHLTVDETEITSCVIDCGAAASLVSHILSKVSVVTSHRRQLFHALSLRGMVVNFMWLVKHNSRCLLAISRLLIHSW